MSLAIQHCAPINNDNTDNNYDLSSNNKNFVNQPRRNKTNKNNKINHEKSRELMQHIAKDGYNLSTNSDEDVDDIMGNFTALPKNYKTTGHAHIQKMKSKMNDSSNESDEFADYSKLPQTFPTDYNTIGSDNFQENIGINNVSNAELLKKLDNVLHILEEQSEEKTNYIIEELILYIFLGVFIIFVIDSFVRVGKYVR